MFRSGIMDGNTRLYLAARTVSQFVYGLAIQERLGKLIMFGGVKQMHIGKQSSRFKKVYGVVSIEANKAKQTTELISCGVDIKVNPSRVVSFPSSPRLKFGFVNLLKNRGEEGNETTRDGFILMPTPHDMGSVVCLDSVASLEITPHTLSIVGRAWNNWFQRPTNLADVGFWSFFPSIDDASSSINRSIWHLVAQILVVIWIDSLLNHPDRASFVSSSL
ncbi:hypothetical protein LXL04_015269 [Taraxacum kok-saghyz]